MENGKKRAFSYELIKDYLDGILDEQTAAQVEAHLATDEVAADIAKGILTMQNKFDGDEESIDRYLQNLQDKQQEIMTSVLNESPAKPSRNITFLKAAASVAFIAAATLAFFALLQPSAEDVVSDELAAPYLSVTAVRSNDDTRSFFESAMDQYESAKYAEAASILLQAIEQEQNVVTAQFYLGLSYLYDSKAELAITHLEGIANTNNRFQAQASWFLALAYFRVNRCEESNELLRRIKNSQAYMSDAALRLSKKIKC